MHEVTLIFVCETSPSSRGLSYETNMSLRDVTAVYHVCQSQQLVIFYPYTIIDRFIQRADGK